MHPQLDQFHLQPVLIDGRHGVSMLMEMPSSEPKQHVSPQEMAILTGLSQDSQYKPYELVDNIAVIPVRGALMHNLGYCSSWATGYDVIRRKLMFARADPEVKGIYMPFHTPGGSVAGCPDTGDLLYEVAQEKPIWTLSDDMSYSAGQWLHSQGSRRLVTQSGGMGSIGVLIGHVDMSGALESAGIKISLLHAGDHKVDGNPYEALSDAVRTKLEASCEKTRQQFATVVARGTGLNVDAILATEAECYTGSEAVDIGLADAVVSSNYILDEFAEFLEQPSRITNLSGQSMSKTLPQPAAKTPAPEQGNPEQQGAAIPQVAPSEPAPDAAAQERTRISTIMKSDAAKSNPGLAEHLAYSTSMGADEALAILGASAPVVPKEAAKPKAGSDAFLAAMNDEEHPNVSSDADDSQHASGQLSDKDMMEMAQDYAAATGIHVKQVS